MEQIIAKLLSYDPEVDPEAVRTVHTASCAYDRLRRLSQVRYLHLLPPLPACHHGVERGSDRVAGTVPGPRGSSASRVAGRGASDWYGP